MPLFLSLGRNPSAQSSRDGRNRGRAYASQYRNCDGRRIAGGKIGGLGIAEVEEGQMSVVGVWVLPVVRGEVAELSQGGQHSKFGNRVFTRGSPMVLAAQIMHSIAYTNHPPAAA